MGESTEVSWGLSHLANKALAEGSQAAWGARTIWSPHDRPDVLSDRQGIATPGHVDDAGARARRRGFTTLLNARLEKAWARLEDLTCSIGGILPLSRHDNQDITLFDDHIITIVGNPRSSCGYLYVAAWLKPVTTEYQWSNRNGLPVPDFGDKVHTHLYFKGEGDTPMGNVTVLTHCVMHDYMSVICQHKDGEVLLFGCDITEAK